MVLAFTEDQKEQIEESGLLVVEYKKLLHDMLSIVIEEIKKAAYTIGVVFGKACEALAELDSLLPKTLCCERTGQKYTFVREYSKCKKRQNNIYRKIIPHCRNNC